ncbi:MAG TPA: prolipoprotein diacylglyceryl transferase family protein [Terracidiphilus sp.]|nr:prolipoprotein diacylglyceryl transferase family protein [Terracidiphilus sp.]
MYPILFRIGSALIPAYGAMAALGVVFALLLAQRTARIARLSPASIWNLCVLALFAALVAARLLLVIANWKDVVRHPSWILGLGMIHHPLVGAVGALAGFGCGALYARARQMPILSVADVLAAPVAFGLAMEQWGALLAGSGFGVDAGKGLPWAVTYTNPLAAVWGGAPLGYPLQPVQAYAAIGFLALFVVLLLWLPRRRQQGDVAGLGLMGVGVVVYVTELWRDHVGRGSVLGGALDGPQIASVALLLAGALLLRERVAAQPRETAVRAEDAPADREASHG